MPIVQGNQNADIQIAVAAEMDKASAKKVQDAIRALSAEERAAIESQVKGERLLARVEAERVAVAKKQTDAIKAQEAAQNRYRASLMKSREEAEKLQQISQKAVIAGAAILAPFIASTQKFIQSASATDPVAKQYRASMTSIESSAVRLGRATTETLNPALKATAEIVSGLVGVMEKNPALLNGVLGIGGGLAALGTIGTVVAQVKMVTSTLALLTGSGAGSADLAARMTMAAAGESGTGTMAGASGMGTFMATAAPLALSSLLAVGAIAIIGSAIKQYEQNPNGEKGPVFLPGGVSASQKDAARRKMLGISDTDNRIDPWVLSQRVAASKADSEAFRASEREPTAREKVYSENLWKATRERYAAEEKTAKELADTEKKASEQRVKALEDYQAKVESIEKSIAETTRNYLSADKEAHEDYYNNRMDMARASGIEAERAEEDHQKTIRKIQKDSDQRIYTMRLERDALGIVLEKRNAETQRKETEENYRTEVRRKNQDMADRLRIMDREFAIANQRRLAEYNYSIALKTAEVQAAQQAYQVIVNGANAMVSALRQAMSAGAAASGNAATTPAAPPLDEYGHYRGFASGGTVDRTGPAIVHKDEIVLNRQNRRIAENLIGGTLSQAGIMDLIKMAAQGRSATINNNFGQSVTIRQVAQLVDASSQSLAKTIERSLKAA